MLLSLYTSISAQSCPSTGSFTLSATSKAATCASNGEITVTISGTSTDLTTLQLYKDATEISSQPNPTLPYTWNTLAPGNYTVKLICTGDNDVVYGTKDITVANNYTEISSADISLSGVCTNFEKGGTFTVNGVVGGSAPYEYKIVKTNDSNFPETQGTTQPAILSKSMISVPTKSASKMLAVLTRHSNSP